jgi:hypothetical protein
MSRRCAVQSLASPTAHEVAIEVADVIDFGFRTQRWRW